MITEQDVYVAYRKAKSFHSGKGFKLPSDWESYFENKMTPKNREYLIETTKYFNTVWSNINLDRYMEVGFELFKTYSYHMFLNPKVLDLYIIKDKQRKRKIDSHKGSIINSMIFIMDVMKDIHIPEGYSALEMYCRIKSGNEKRIIKDYLLNYINPLVMVYCIYYKYLKLNDIEREYVYNISNSYRDLLQDMFEVEKYIKENENGLILKE